LTGFHFARGADQFCIGWSESAINRHVRNIKAGNLTRMTARSGRAGSVSV
jgi:hypothetical protein